MDRLNAVVLLFLFYNAVFATKPHYKMCVPHIIYESCKGLVTNQSSDIATLECVAGRDRMECLEKVNRREADFLAVDPEDMYVAANLNNEDFSIFSQIRTVEEPDAEFRYEGIILVHKNSNIKTLSDLKGKKSCHTGYGRNVGYKIPVTKLKKYGVLQISSDSTLSPLEKELNGLSELFNQSCLVGKYSPNTEVNQVLKKRYSNLCALCENPRTCDYPDKYSGYEGAIRCLVENGGDVAFTKVIFVRKFFGLSVHGRPSNTIAQANPVDYEYLCADGSRVPVTEKACSWAQRPWAGYLGNGDVKKSILRLQNRIQEFYNASKASSDKLAVAKLGINQKYLVVNTEIDISPGLHLNNAQYKDVIERDGTTEQKIRLCVRTDIEQKKCDVLAKAAYSRDIRPEFKCILSGDCVQSVSNNASDVVILTASDHLNAKNHGLHSILQEKLNAHYLIVIEKDRSSTLTQKLNIQYNANDTRSENAALRFNIIRNNNKKCAALTTDESAIRAVKTTELMQKSSAERHELICLDLSKKPITSENLSNCYFDATPPTSVFVRNELYGHELDNIVHAFTHLAEKFGMLGSLPDVFTLFGGFKINQPNIIFSDDAVGLVSAANYIDTIDELYQRLDKC